MNMLNEELQDYEQLQKIILFLNYHGPLFIRTLPMEESKSNKTPVPEVITTIIKTSNN